MRSNPVEIANVFSCRLDVIWRIGCAGIVSGNSGHRLERLDHIERRDPLLAAFGIRLTQMKMNVVVERIAANGQSDRRDVETGLLSGLVYDVATGRVEVVVPAGRIRAAAA